MILKKFFILFLLLTVFSLLTACSGNHSYTYSELAEMTDEEICGISEEIAEKFNECEAAYYADGSVGDIRIRLNGEFDDENALTADMGIPEDIIQSSNFSYVYVGEQPDGEMQEWLVIQFHKLPLSEFQRLCISLMYDDNAAEVIPDIYAYNIPEDYKGHSERISEKGYIFKPVSTAINVSKYFKKEDIKNVRLTDEIYIGWGAGNAYYTDGGTYGGYEFADRDTGIYFTEKQTQLFYTAADKFEVLYNVYGVRRCGIAASSDNDVQYPEKLIEPKNILENDANDDGAVDSADALKILDVISGSDMFTVEEKIQLGITESCDYNRHEPYTAITAEDALKILQRTVNSEN